MNTEDIDSLDDNLAVSNEPQNQSIQPTGPVEPTKPDPLYAIPNVTNEPQVANPVLNTSNDVIPEMTPVQNDMASVTTAPEAVSLNDMVSPTNLESNDISKFGQEGIPLNNINQNPKPSSLESVTKSDEYNNIGVVPANAHVEQKIKKPLNPKMVLIAAVVLVVLIGIGVFAYLRMGQNAAKSLKLKNVKVQLSDVLSTNVNDYVASGKIDTSCVTNFDDVQINKIGHYQYKIICDSGTVVGYIDVVDEQAPTITTKTVYKLVGQTIDKNDFIESCEDVSGCVTVLDDEETVKNYLTTAGSHEVTLTVKDGNNNEKKVSSYLIVTNTEVSRNLICTSKQFENTDEQYNYKIKDSVGILIEDGDIKNAGFTFRDYIINYSSDEAYKKAKDSIKDGNITLSLVSGKATFNDAEKQIIVKKMMSVEELNSEFELYPDEYSALRSAYENHENEYECVTESK